MAAYTLYKIVLKQTGGCISEDKALKRLPSRKLWLQGI